MVGVVVVGLELELEQLVVLVVEHQLVAVGSWIVGVRSVAQGVVVELEQLVALDVAHQLGVVGSYLVVLGAVVVGRARRRSVVVAIVVALRETMGMSVGAVVAAQLGVAGVELVPELVVVEAMVVGMVVVPVVGEVEATVAVVARVVALVVVQLVVEGSQLPVVVVVGVGHIHCIVSRLVLAPLVGSFGWLGGKSLGVQWLGKRWLPFQLDVLGAPR